MTEYTTITCIKCDKVGQNSYCEPFASRMIERQMCYICSHWTDFDVELQTKHARKTIIEGNVYSPGNRTSGSFRGMAGRRFDIEYIAPSIFAGKRTTTFDLWSGGMMPDWLKAKWPDTAKFLNEAVRADLGKGGIFEAAWNPSRTKDVPYPLPRELEL